MKYIFAYSDQGTKSESIKHLARKRYPPAELKKLLDYLYNDNFALADDICVCEEIDAIDGKPFEIFNGTSSDGVFFWTSTEPLYILKHGLAVTDEFEEHADDYYKNGNIVSSVSVDWALLKSAE